MGAIDTFTLCDGDVSVRMLSLGCITQDWQVPLAGRLVPVVLGHAEPDAYRAAPHYMGQIVGVVANRISGARFTLDGQTFHIPANEGPNLLHGGAGGLGQRLWRGTQDGPRAVRFVLDLAHLEDGFPGRRRLSLQVTLCGHRLRYDIYGETDRPTPMSLAQHSYYTLGMDGPLWPLRCRIAAGAVTPCGPDRLPAGQILPLDGLAHDLRTPRSLARADPARAGIDLNYVLDGGGFREVAALRAPNGMGLRLSSDQPGLQLYTGAGLGAGLGSDARPLAGQRHAPFHGLCLEPQGLPDSVNIPRFGDIIITPDRPYRQRLEVEIKEDTT
ncbi:MAG: galactose mutarotase [Marinibacterium sp.]|nr:galactose mutarotase [Marinibacterium sp.]